MVARISRDPDPEDLAIESTDNPEDDTALPLNYEIASYPADYTLRVLNDQLQENQLVLPRFQRSYVWNATQASRLIESFLLGLPVPEVFLYKQRSKAERLVVDGHQRLATISYFYQERFPDDKIFRLRGVDDRWAGKTYRDLDEIDRSRFDNSTLRSIVIQQLDPSDRSSINLIFERLNTGGIRLNAMEIRRVQFSETAYALLERLNGDGNWRSLLGTSKPNRRLRDVELVLRVLAMADVRGTYRKPLRGFLNDYMYTLNAMDSDARERAGLRFTEACRVANAQLGPKPFHIHGPLNVAALDSVMGILTEGILVRKDLQEGYRLLLQDESFLAAIGRATSDEDSVERRFARALEALRLHP